jgi:hypothetical protein
VSQPDEFIFQTLDGKLIPCRSVLGAIGIAVSSPLRTIGEDSESTQMSKNSLLFVSPSPTNGQGLLGLNSALLVRACNHHTVKLHSVEYKSFGPQDAHHLTDDWWKHILKLCMNWYCTAHVNVSPECIYMSNEEQVAQAKSFLARLSNPVSAETNIDPALFREFREYWRETRERDYAKSK